MKEKEKQKSKEEVKDKNLPTAPLNFEGDKGAGFETADKDSYAIPFLVVLQTNSPQCNEDDGAYVKGAKAGMFFNTATKELYDGKVGVKVVPSYYQHKFTEWVPRNQGGGYRGEHLPEDVDTTKLKRDESGRFVLDNGNYLADTRYHFCIQLTPGGPRMVVLSLSSTQIKKSRNWMTLMSTIKCEGAKGKFTPPMFSHVYKITSTSESNDKGDWKGVAIELDHQITQKEADVYALAKEFGRQVGSGRAKVEEPAERGTEGDVF